MFAIWEILCYYTDRKNERNKHKNVQAVAVENRNPGTDNRLNLEKQEPYGLSHMDGSGASIVDGNLWKPPVYCGKANKPHRPRQPRKRPGK